MVSPPQFLIKHKEERLKLLVTGGAGFIGSCFIRLALESHPDWEITNIDKFTYAANIANLGEYAKKIHTIQADISEDEAYADLDDDFNWIVHLAAESHVDRSIENSYPFLKTNIMGTHRLLEFIRESRERGSDTLLLHIGTDEVYGDVTRPSFETANLNPSSPYSASKASADHLVKVYGRTHQIPYVITRSVNNYGPYQYPEKLLPLFITNLLRDRKVGLYGDGKQIREWLWVEDHVRVLLYIVNEAPTYRPLLGQTFNIGSGLRMTNLDITRELLLLMGKNDTYIEFVEDRKGHDRMYAVNCERFKSITGWKPQVELQDGLKKTIEWYKNNKNWWGGGVK